MFWRNPTALAQVILVSVVCFTCPGLFNALTNIAAGVADPTITYNGSAILYAFFAVFGFFGGGVVNIIGPKWTLFIGTWGYVLYSLSLLFMDENYDKETNQYASLAKLYFYIANALLGIGAGFLWTAQGQMCMAYPTQETKGTYFAYFWVIFNLGGTLGGFMAFGTNYDLSTDGASASTLTYIIFLILMSCGALLSLFLANPENVVRNDGSRVLVARLPSPTQEILATARVFVDPKMLLLFPLFAYSNWFYSYHSFFNTAFFNTRSASLSSAFYWAAQMLGAYTVGIFLDRPGPKKFKALRSILIIGASVMVMWGAACWLQLDFDLSNDEGKQKNIDFQEARFYPKWLLYMYFGFNDAVVQVWSYWLMGQLSDDLGTLGRYSGYYKCVQSGMAAVAWRLNGIPVSGIASLTVSWAIAALGMVGAYISVYNYLADVPRDRYDEFDMLDEIAKDRR
ncbi:unnamed protein product [Aphanomyces euteiches]|uniref:Major facilitator superfamily (MFS) profile domain-containing protein n=1 Tax=Aphanomyces euteiches TaxID=100861 RepID=A0A6G0WCZ3_9STRA|nr:hypothetical protein Ae201684_016574 [Aphanomyces euteiches]KAH9084097.1 hypothetical protein Ae201684P_020354 [Aphanomyces euteiches]KAH9144509.1 hypothetical protein AeRB84_011562 [Aphanomyces euteiches]